MFLHYLKIAFRNMWIYRTQNIISVVGLAVGFVCFAFSALWIRYEMSYDNFHPKADRIYRVNTKFFKWDTAGSSSAEIIQDGTAYPLANWLKSNFPEIEEACAILTRNPEPLKLLYLDRNFCKIFDMNLSENFFVEGQTDKLIAVLPEFNNKTTAESIKKLFNWDVRMTAMPRWPANTNIKFNTAIPITTRFSEHDLNNWNFNWFDTYILIKNGADVKALEKKLDKVVVPEWTPPISIVLTPLKQLRYKDPTGNIQSEIKFAPDFDGF